MKNEGWEKQQVKRASYRAVLRSGMKEESFSGALAACQSVMEREKEKHWLLTASLYRYGRFLFFYSEGVRKTVWPDLLCAPMTPYLQKWPPMMEEPGRDRAWMPMQPYYYHALPGTAEDWMQNRKPSLRRGRIALLAPDRWESYMTHHLALMREGLIEGDRYHLICAHENVLFSYFEEPKTMTNLRQEPGVQGTALEDWMRTDPESHFMRFTPGQGPGPDGNFVFLPLIAGV